jgi:hypothetical protein
MFKTASVESELLRSMEQNLVKSQVETEHGFNKLAQAIDLLSSAAAIFDEAGMHQEADSVTEILQGLAKDLK